ncbi:MAG TPA: S41 family peptidase [Anaerohalosphaeraceae bacterium]|nr:S41 family peptidase [Anaerohalosphaeraceae bacterium]
MNLKNQKNAKSVIRWVLIIMGLWLVLGCEPDSPGYPSKNSSESNETSSASVSLPVSLKAASAIDFFCTGNPAAARETLEAAAGENGTLETFRQILLNWEQMQQRRQNVRLQVWAKQQERLKELEKNLGDSLKTEMSAANPAPEEPALSMDEDLAETVPDADPNGLEGVLAAAIRLRDLATDEEKQALLQQPFIQQAVQAALQRARLYEEQGRWTDAYIRAYYWLTALDEDNPEYRNKAEELSELLEIELSLKDGSCDDTVKKRYEDIKTEMFERALYLLDNNYVRPLEYKEMIQKAFQRCRLLARVLEKSSAEIAYHTDAQTARQFLEKLDAVETEMKDKTDLQAADLKGLLESLLDLNQNTLNLPPEVLIAHFSQAVFQTLDPFTELVWPWYVKDFEKNLTQQFSGIGVEISKATGVLTIVSLLPDTPAYRAGLDAYDEILAVNGEPTEKMTIFCAVSKITGPKGTKVTLTIRRPSTGEVKDYTIVRDRIVVQPIRGWQRTENGQWDFWVDKANRIGYVRLTSFSETSRDELDQVLTQLEKEGMKALILNLRYNSGGYLNSAAEVADLFLSKGIIVKSNPRHGFAAYEMAHEKGTHPNYPMVVLINGGSASASEIVAGALQDPKYRRATLVGTRSYGKGSVQVVTPFTGGGSQLKYTVAYYHLPSDQPVKNRYQIEKLGRKDWGIAPDVEVEMYSHEIRRMLEIQRRNDILVQAFHNNGEERRYTLEETLLSDPQLSAALLIVQAKLLQQGCAVQPPDLNLWQQPVDPNEVL